MWWMSWIWAICETIENTFRKWDQPIAIIHWLGTNCLAVSNVQCVSFVFSVLFVATEFRIQICNRKMLTSFLLLFVTVKNWLQIPFKIYRNRFLFSKIFKLPENIRPHNRKTERRRKAIKRILKIVTLVTSCWVHADCLYSFGAHQL